MPDTSPALAELAGVWRRSLLVDEGGRDTTSVVTLVTRRRDLLVLLFWSGIEKRTSRSRG